MRLQQAKAEVEECYRRRAWRAGLGDTLPVGRPMTEEELEDLRWQLGDFGPAGGYGSRGKKRHQDPIDMTIEEMAAEIEETNEAIRKRRRGNLGLMLKPLWILTIIACFVGEPVAAFTAYDCSDRSNLVESYTLLEPDACANSGRDGEVETTVYGEIVQIKQDRMIPVFRCTVIRDPHSAALQDVLACQCDPVPQVPGAQSNGGLGVPEGQNERVNPHQWTPRRREGGGDCVPHHVFSRRPGR
jgi:hypothetical protein